MANGEQAVPPPRGGRCVRARELAYRRAAGEQLPDYDSRLLESHLVGCSACTAYVESLPAETVPGGADDPTRARVGVVEEESRKPEETGAEADRDELFEHEHHQPSQVDAMGQDKHRQVVGQSYGPTRQRQLAYYGIFLAFVIVVYIGASFAISELDKAPSNPSGDHAPAPWARANAPQVPLGGFSTDDRGGVTHFQ